MVRRQRYLSDAGGVVLEGRDIGTVVLPGADVKVYLDASLEVRAQRRLKELEAKGLEKDVRAVERDLAERDDRDSNRDVSPLKVPIGAEIVDTTKLTIDEQVDCVIHLAERRAEELHAMLPEDGGANPATKRRFYFSLVQILARVAGTVAWGFRVVRKDPLIYNENYIFASNHRSNADPPLVGSSIPRDVHFVAKEPLFRIPGLGWLITRLNALPIRRNTFDRATMDMCVDLLAGGKSLLIFPEGGRVTGDALGRPRPGVGYLAINSGAPVVPVYVEGTAKLRRALFRRPRVTAIFGRPMRPTNPDLSGHQNANDYREFGEMVMCALEALKDEHEHNSRRHPA